MPYMDTAKDNAPTAYIEDINNLQTTKKNKMASMEQMKENQTAQITDSDQQTTLAVNGEIMEGIELTSRPPTPPTRPDSPSKMEGPARLFSRIPAKNFGAVTDRLIYRSAFPTAHNLGFLDELNIKTMLCFVDTDPTTEYTGYINDKEINRVRVDILANKEGQVKTTVASICEALLTVLDANNYPLYVHCNQGRHRTGCVIACMRKVQGWPIKAILAEYDTYANPKMRPGDHEFITNVFQPEALLQYAKSNGNFDHRPSLSTLLRNNVLDVDKFVQFLSSKDGIASSNTSLRTIETMADSGVDMTNAVVDPMMLLMKSTIAMPSVDTEVSVSECEPMSPPASTADSQPFFGSLH